MSGFFSVLTAYLLYTMSSVPFIVWAGRSAYAGTVASRGTRAWPGIMRTIFRLLLPLGLIFLYAWNVYGAAGSSAWVPYQFLLLPPALGSIAGYGVGFFMGKRTRY